MKVRKPSPASSPLLSLALHEFEILRIGDNLADFGLQPRHNLGRRCLGATMPRQEPIDQSKPEASLKVGTSFSISSRLGAKIARGRMRPAEISAAASGRDAVAICTPSAARS